MHPTLSLSTRQEFKCIFIQKKSHTDFGSLFSWSCKEARLNLGHTLSLASVQSHSLPPHLPACTAWRQLTTHLGKAGCMQCTPVQLYTVHLYWFTILYYYTAQLYKAALSYNILRCREHRVDFRSMLNQKKYIPMMKFPGNCHYIWLGLETLGYYYFGNHNTLWDMITFKQRKRRTPHHTLLK